MNYDDLCKKIMGLNKEIRFVGILGKNGDLISGGSSNGTKSLLTPNEVQMSLHYAAQRWQARKNLSHRIGRAKYSMTVYEKIKQFSIPINNNDLLLISTEPNTEHEKVIRNIINLIDENFKTN